MASKSPQSKYDRAHALVTGFIARHRHQCGAGNWPYLGHLIWCETRHNPVFLSAVVRVAAFYLARQALTENLPTIVISED